MQRRDFGKVSIGVVASTILAGAAKPAGPAGNVPPVPEFPHTKGLTNYVAEFVTTTKYAEIPEEVIELGKKSILDGLGLALAGSRADTGPLCRQYVKNAGICGGKATIIGTSQKTTPRFAAFVNGVSIHADDFDDTQLAVAKDRVYGLLVHPTVPVLPGVLALAEQGGVSGKDLMLAYHIGVEVECKIAEAIAPRHYQDGFHSTGTCGPFGSAAACARLQHFDIRKTLNAFGVVGSLSGGLRENFGTMTKPFQAGHAAESGVVSADL
ncbi:MAG TPA: MmgE/PrpD family protein, partial [Candidatus Eremiobacteraceae bacterium]|nr:MmgE/PrpD family protein [Candidatus Eremiobacteraceae bacterium]